MLASETFRCDAVNFSCWHKVLNWSQGKIILWFRINCLADVQEYYEMLHSPFGEKGCRDVLSAQKNPALIVVSHRLIFCTNQIDLGSFSPKNIIKLFFIKQVSGEAVSGSPTGEGTCLCFQEILGTYANSFFWGGGGSFWPINCLLFNQWTNQLHLKTQIYT